MKRIVIIGGGFSGLAAAAYLKKYKEQVEVVLIDRKKETVFLPLLPDILSCRINYEFLSAELAVLAEKFSFKFIHGCVSGIDLKENKVSFAEENIYYDYLIIAAGSQTNFYNNIPLSKSAFKLDDIEDAKIILNNLDSDEFDTFVISGGGYTGIEIATNIHRYFIRKRKTKKIIIIEKSKKFLGLVPEYMREYVINNLSALGVEMRVDSEVESALENKVVLKNKECFDKAMLIWAAGVKAQDFLKNITADVDSQGRIFVDEYLRLSNNCFCCGDTAHFKQDPAALRMSVQFAIMQGETAAMNVIRNMDKLTFLKYSPRDLGYIIPMANNKACGIVLGFKVKGFLAVKLHYLMCIFRSVTLKNKLGIISNLLNR
ncbi:MAG: FAD-dependent oxidoreductase [Candidatus Omnitrophota bacterium]